MMHTEASLRKMLVDYIMGASCRAQHLPGPVSREVNAIVANLQTLRQRYHSSLPPAPERSREERGDNATNESGIMQIASSTDVSLVQLSNDSQFQRSPPLIDIRTATPGTSELITVLGRSSAPAIDTHANVQAMGEAVARDRNAAPNLGTATPTAQHPINAELRPLSLAERLQPQNFALSDTPVINPRENFNIYTIHQLKESMKQLGKRYVSREQAILVLRHEFTTTGWVPRVNLTQLQLMSPARRQTLEEMLTDWIKKTPWYLLILTFVPVNKRKMLEHMKRCRLSISMETLNSYLLSQNVLMAEGEENDSTSLNNEKLKIHYPRQNGEQQLTLSEILAGGSKRTRKGIRRLKK